MILKEREQNVLNYLREYKEKGGIDTFKLMYKAKNTRPANEVSELRKKGFNIVTIPCKNRNTEKIYYKYLLISEPG